MFFSQVLLKIFLILNKVQETKIIFFITFECPRYQLFPSKILHCRHHFHLPQSLGLTKHFLSHQTYSPVRGYSISFTLATKIDNFPGSSHVTFIGISNPLCTNGEAIGFSL